MNMQISVQYSELMMSYLTTLYTLNMTFFQFCIYQMGFKV